MSSPDVLNSPMEVGLRGLVLLVEASPGFLDLQQLVTLDYFLVHSGDVEGGPESLHPPSPLRSGEVAVRRDLLAKGLTLYQIRGLVEYVPTERGFAYGAEGGSGTFLDSLRTTYVNRLRERAIWVIERFGLLEHDDMRLALASSLSRWQTEFAPIIPMWDDE